MPTRHSPGSVGKNVKTGISLLVLVSFLFNLSLEICRPHHGHQRTVDVPLLNVAIGLATVVDEAALPAAEAGVNGYS